MYTGRGTAISIVLSIFCAVLLNGCGKSKEQEAAEAFAAKMAEASKKMEEVAKAAKSATPPTPEQAMKQAAEAIGAASGAIGAMMGGGDGKSAVEPVDFRQLQTVLPEAIGALKRGDVKGEKTAAMGIKVSSSEATYSAGDEKRIRLKIVDTGSMSGFAGMASAAWAIVDIDRESSSGYEKTSTVAGRRIFEKWDKEGKSGQVNMIVDQRFIIEMRGNGIEIKDLKQAAAALDFKKLEELKSAEPAAAAAAK